MDDIKRGEIETIYRIYEDDYGCEERPEDAPEMVIVCLEGENGERRFIRIAEQELLRYGLDEGNRVRQEGGALLPA